MGIAERGAGVEHDFGVLQTGVGVEGDLQLQPAFGALKHHALVQLRLGGTGEVQVPVTGEVHDRRAQDVGAEIRLFHDQARGLGRLGVEHEAGGENRVAANVEDGPAAHIGLVAHVTGIDVVEAELAVDRPYLANSAGLHQLSGLHPLRIEADHEGLGQDQVRAQIHQRFEFRRAEGDRLLAQHVLARLQRPARPFDVQVVGQGDIDRIDVIAFEQGVVGDWPRPAGDGNEATVIAGLDRGLQPVAADFRVADHTPSYFTHGPVSSLKPCLWAALCPQVSGRGAAGSQRAG